MAEREISLGEIRAVLRAGMCRAQEHRGRHWTYTMERTVNDRRLDVVTVILEEENGLLVITVYEVNIR